jgi:gliding motility-associated lipoprotein GldH
MRKMTLPVSTMHSDRSEKRIFSNARHVYSILILAILLFITGCDRNLVFEKNKTLPDAVWKSVDIAKFNVAINDSSVFYDFYLNIRISSEYKYSNLFLFMKTLYPNGQISSDTVECFFADARGKWLGSRSGRIIDNRILMLKNMKYPMKGVYSFEFEQAMRDTVLQNVEDFGIRVEKSQDETVQQ